MKSIGFIDAFVNNWHALNYPTMIRNSAYGDRMAVTVAWEEQAHGDKSLEQFCAEQKIKKAASIDEVVAASDYIVVLAPRNPEKHEALADAALRSGKPVYIDKPFAPSLEAGKRLFDKARKHNAPMFSSSALRFDSRMGDAPLAGGNVKWVNVRGGGAWHEYAIHQIEMLVATLGTGATRVMHAGSDAAQALLVDYADGRRGTINLIPGHPFQISAAYDDNGTIKAHAVNEMSDFFPRFIDAMLRFFDTRQSPVPEAQTLQIAAIIEAGNAALQRPFEWVAVPR